MSPEHEMPHSVLGELPARLDKETLWMSGGFERLQGFQDIVKHGEPALPELLQSIEESNWWKVQAVCTIARDIGKPIDFAEETLGRYAEIRDQIVTWATTNGYLAEAPTE